MEPRNSTIAIVQARMGSTRLPGKVLMDIGAQSALARVISRLQRARLIDRIIVATTDASADDILVSECVRLGVSYFRGSENDVLDRYYQAALALEASTVVRITADCPLIDPELVDETVTKFQEERADYASNALRRTYPRGLDAEAFTVAALQRAWTDASKPYQREHVTPYFYEHPEIFSLASLVGESDYSQYRWTLDTREDMDLLRIIYERFDEGDDFTWRDVVALMVREPQLANLNREVLQKSLY